MNPISTAELETTNSQSPEDERARILVVGNEEKARESLEALLKENGYLCTSVEDAEAARPLVSSNEFAVVFMDMDMPDDSGVDLATEIAQDQDETAVFMLAGESHPQLATTALDMGAYGYMVKPTDSNEVLINVANALKRRNLELENRSQREQLQRMVRERTTDLWDAIAKLEGVQAELRGSREETIERLSIAAEFRDNETVRHLKRISAYCELLARTSGMDEDHQEMIRLASQLHDVGKIGIPDSILLKPGRLSDEERKIMERHTEIGYRILAGSKSEILSIAASVALTHHERYDGTGYPRGLSGEDIPVEGRMMAVADVFDGLTTHRVYKDPVPLEEAVGVMKLEKENQLDPDLVDMFLGSLDTILEIKNRYDES